MRKQVRIDVKKDRTKLDLEIEFRRKGNMISSEEIMRKYIEHPYMERYF
jgi:hypothetical protein